MLQLLLLYTTLKSFSTISNIDILVGLNQLFGLATALILLLNLFLQ